MEQHGDNPHKNVIAVIPARFASTRLPGKLLLRVGGRAIVVHTADRASAAKNVGRVIVAADDEKIVNEVKAAGFEAVMTSTGHASGSDRVAEVAGKMPAGSVIVNVQGDEPLIAARTIEIAVDAMLADESADIVTTCEKFERAEDVLDPNTVKVVRDADGMALYFSRSPIPYLRREAEQHGSQARALAAEA